MTMLAAVGPELEACRTLRVCFVTEEFYPDVGGAALAAERIVRSLAATGIDLHVFAPQLTNLDEKEVVLERLSDRITLYRIPLSRPRLLRFQTEISAVDTSFRFHLFHAFFLHMAIPCLAVARGSRPVIASIRGIDARWMLEPWYADAAYSVLRQASWITSVSTTALSAAQALVDLTDRCSFIPNCIDANAIPAWSPQTAELGTVGTVCTFRPKKEIPLLVRAYSLVSREVRRRLLLVGTYKGKAKLEAQRNVEAAIQETGLAEEITITGYIPRKFVLEHLLRMSVFVVSSSHEGMPNAALEAAACGVPIVSTSVDGMVDIFRDEESALFVPCGDANAMGAAVERILRDPVLAMTLSRGARKVAEALTPALETRTWLTLYDSLQHNSCVHNPLLI